MRTLNFNIDSTDLAIMEQNLARFGNNYLPKAVRSTLNDAVRHTRTLAIESVERDMVLRNKFTTRSILFDASGTKTDNIDAMRAKVGSLQDYMKTQEQGGSVKGKQGASKPIPTHAASGESASASPRRRLVRNNMRMSKISLRANARNAKTPKQAFFFAAVQTLQEKNQFVMLDSYHNGRRGIYRVRGRLTKRKSWQIEGLQMRMVWNMEKTQVKLIPRKWLEPASVKASQKIPEFYEKNMRFRLDKLKLRVY